MKPVHKFWFSRGNVFPRLAVMLRAGLVRQKRIALCMDGDSHQVVVR
jgi:hypothetical protein